MRTTLLATALLLTLPAFAAPPSQATGTPPGSAGIRLDQLKTSGSAATGRCGSAEVKVQGIEPDPQAPGQTRISSQGKITVISGRASLNIGSDDQATIYLQDHNKLHCVDTAKGRRLVLATVCFARYCTPLDYRVIDPSTAKVVGMPKGLEECDRACAEKALGQRLPEDLVD